VTILLPLASDEAYIPAMKKLNKTEAARHLKVSRQTIYDLIKRDILVPDANGLLTFDDDSAESTAECQDRFSACPDTHTESDITHSVTDVVIGSRRLKNQYIHDLKGEIERLQHTLKARDQELKDREGFISILQAYAAFLEDTLAGHHINVQPHLKKFITQYLSPEHLQHAKDILLHLHDDAVHMDAELDLARR
jgi:hypothetical protein